MEHQHRTFFSFGIFFCFCLLTVWLHSWMFAELASSGSGRLFERTWFSFFGVCHFLAWWKPSVISCTKHKTTSFRAHSAKEILQQLTADRLFDLLLSALSQTCKMEKKTISFIYLFTFRALTVVILCSLIMIGNFHLAVALPVEYPLLGGSPALHEWQQGWNLQGGWRGKLLPLPGMKTREQI